MRIQDLVVAVAVCAGLGWFATPQKPPPAPPVATATPAAGVSICGIVVGTPANDVLTLLGKPISTGNENAAQMSFRYPPPDSDGVYLDIMWGKESGRVQTILGPDLTVNGKSVPRGSSYDEIVAALGKPDELLANRPSAYLVYPKYNLCIRFVSRKGEGTEGAVCYEMRSDLDKYMHFGGHPLGDAEFRRDWRVEGARP